VDLDVAAVDKAKREVNSLIGSRSRQRAKANELEAIPSHTLREMVRQHLESHIAPDRLTKVLKLAEEEERKGLEQLEDLIGRGAA